VASLTSYHVKLVIKPPNAFPHIRRSHLHPANKKPGGVQVQIACILPFLTGEGNLMEGFRGEEGD